MKSLIAIDTEFNKDKKILSLGVYSEKIKGEYYFKNKVDKYTYQVHCLKNDFLKEYGKVYNKEDFNFIFEHDYIIGFDIYQDLHVLDYRKKDTLYTKNKIIDLKILINAFNLNCSLNDLICVFDIKVESALLHSAYFDAKLSYEVLFKIYETFKSSFKDFESFLHISSKLTFSHKFGYSWEYDDISYNYFLKNNKSVENLKEKFQKYKDNNNKSFEQKIFTDNEFIYVFKNDMCEFKFPKKFLNKDIDIEYNKDIDYPKIGIKFKYEITGGI